MRNPIINHTNPPGMVSKLKKIESSATESELELDTFSK